MTTLTVRRGIRADVGAVLGLLDRATEWLVAQGRTDQWGTEPHSVDPRRVAQITGSAADGGLWIAESDGQVVGALAVGAAMPYVPPATEPELYVRLLVTDRALARGLGVELLRVDCFAGGDGALVRYYEKQGFSRAEAFTVPVNGADWPGQVLSQRL